MQIVLSEISLAPSPAFSSLLDESSELEEDEKGSEENEGEKEDEDDEDAAQSSLVCFSFLAVRFVFFMLATVAFNGQFRIISRNT